MKIKLIGCASTLNEIQWLGVSESVDCTILDYSYHGSPAKLHQKLRSLIDESQNYDLIILTYSRCSNAVIGLVSPNVPILMPKTHDCIGLLLGSNERHLKMFRDNPGTYYFSQGWLDYGKDPYTEYLDYVKKYGEKKARVIIEGLYGRYKKAVFIITPGIKDIGNYRERFNKIAGFFGWQAEEIEGDTGLLESLVKGAVGPELAYIEPGREITSEMLK